MRSDGPAADDPPGAGDRASPASLPALRRGSRDMAALLALPAMWVDRAPADIATDLLNVLFAMLRLESGYVRFDDPAGSIEHWRPAGRERPRAIDLALAAAPGPTIDPATNTIDIEGHHIARIVQAFQDEHCVVLASCGRPGFPGDLDLYLMRVVVSQAATAILTARRLDAERSARQAAEAALRVQTDFLAKLADDLESPLALLAARATEARALASHPGGAVRAAAAEPALVAAPHAPRLAPPVALTPREAEVLGLLGQGLSNKEIAGVLWLSDRTVERHITGLYRKLGVERRSEATAFAMRYGLVDPMSA